MNLFARWRAVLRDAAFSPAHWMVVLGLAVLLVGVQAVWARQAEQAARQPAEARWAAGWAVAVLDFREMATNPLMAAMGGAPDTRAFRAQTLRQVLQPSLDGERVRIRFSNRFGKTPLRIAAASVALSTGTDAVSPASLRTLRFGGRTTATIAPGAEAWSDGVALKVEAGQSVAVSLYLDRTTPFATMYLMGAGGGWLAEGNAVMAPKLPKAAPLPMNHIVTGLDVLTTQPVRTVVAFGDSITAGGGESGTGAYPDMLATRLRDSPQAAHEVSVINAGIGGNRLLVDSIGPNGLSRFARDVLGQSGVTHAIVLLGTNDIGRAAFGALPGVEVAPHEVPTAERITDGLGQLVKQARAKGVKVLLGTVPPFGNTIYGTDANEAMREAVNRWVRSRQDVGGVIDFDAVLRDPAAPRQLNPTFDSGDHLHPNRAGHAAMAAAIDLRELQE
ncbi:GDSL-like Lipase/Acylhydrolase family protein [compost metagenome]